MKNYIFALIIGLTVATGAPANAQTNVPCGFPACSKSYEISPVVAAQNPAKLAEFLLCYNNAVDHWETQKDIAWDDFLYDQAYVLGAAAAAVSTCYFGKFKIKKLADLLEAFASKISPYYCGIKAAAAGVVTEAGFVLHLRRQLNRLCKEYNAAVRACARAIDPNFKECDL